MSSNNSQFKCCSIEKKSINQYIQYSKQSDIYAIRLLYIKYRLYERINHKISSDIDNFYYICGRIFSFIKQFEFLLNIYFYMCLMKLILKLRFLRVWFQQKRSIQYRRPGWYKRQIIEWFNIFNPMYEIRYLIRLFKLNLLLQKFKLNNFYALYISGNIRRHFQTSAHINLYVSHKSSLFWDNQNIRINRNLLVQVERNLEFVKELFSIMGPVIHEADYASRFVKIICSPNKHNISKYYFWLFAKRILFGIIFGIIFYALISYMNSPSRKLILNILNFCNHLFSRIGLTSLALIIHFTFNNSFSVYFINSLPYLLIIFYISSLICNKSVEHQMQLIESLDNNITTKHIMKLTICLSHGMETEQLASNILESINQMVVLSLFINKTQKASTSNKAADISFISMMNIKKDEGERFLFMVIIFNIVVRLIILLLNSILCIIKITLNKAFLHHYDIYSNLKKKLYMLILIK